MARKKISDWPAVFQKFADSGMNVAEFCQSISIHPNTYYKNRKKYQSNESQFIRLSPVEKEVVDQKIEIEINGFLIKVADDVSILNLENVLQAIKAVS